MAKAQKGMGFKAAASGVAKKEGVPMKSADAIIAASARKASPAAKKANPNLNKVSGTAPAPPKSVGMPMPAPAMSAPSMPKPAMPAMSKPPKSHAPAPGVGMTIKPPKMK